MATEAPNHVLAEARHTLYVVLRPAVEACVVQQVELVLGQLCEYLADGLAVRRPRLVRRVDARVVSPVEHWVLSYFGRCPQGLQQAYGDTRWLLALGPVALCQAQLAVWAVAGVVDCDHCALAVLSAGLPVVHEGSVARGAWWERRMRLVLAQGFVELWL